jgi:hypothetical protein
VSFERFNPGAFDWDTPASLPPASMPPAVDERIQQALAALDDLECRRPSKAMSEMRWHQLLKDLRHIGDDWLDLALACDWSLLDLFGAPPLFAGRVGLMGVGLLLQGRPIESVDGNRIVIANRLGEPNVFYRHAPGVSVPFDRRGRQLVWDVLARLDSR